MFPNASASTGVARDESAYRWGMPERRASPQKRLADVLASGLLRSLTSPVLSHSGGFGMTWHPVEKSGRSLSGRIGLRFARSVNAALILRCARLPECSSVPQRGEREGSEEAVPFPFYAPLCRGLRHRPRAVHLITRMSCLKTLYNGR